MMDYLELADEIKTGIGQSGATSDENKAFAKAIVDELKAGVVAHAIGTVTGVVPSSGGALLSGTAILGTISGISGATLMARLLSEMALPFASAQISAFASVFISHVITANVIFSVGNITGICSNTALSPGAFVGQGTGGLITGLSGPVLAGALTPIFDTGPTPIGTTTQLLGLSNAIINYVQTNAEVTYPPGSVTGGCSAGGGALLAGIGVGGTIS